MKIHKVAIIRNLSWEIVTVRARATRCGIWVHSSSWTVLWHKVTCKNCLRTKA